jgi:cell division protein FtsB
MKRILSVFTSLVISLSVSTPAWAGACYSSAEYEAEQGLKIKNELMVIALNCQHMAYRKGNLYLRYREISRQNEDLFKMYEQTLMNYYRNNGQNADREIKSLNTNLANKVAVKSANMRPDIFCYNHRDYIEQALEMDREAFRRWAKQPNPSEPTSRPLCRDRDY